MSKDDNGAGSGWVAPIPIPSHLFKIIIILVPLKKLNGEGWDTRNSHTTLSRSSLIFFLITLK